MNSFTLEPKYKSEEEDAPRNGWIKIDGVWHNIIFCYDHSAGELRMYLDGIRVTAMEGMTIDLELPEEDEDETGFHPAAYGS